MLMAAISAVLLYAGGLDVLQTASLIAALPFAVIVLLLGITLWKMLKHEIIPIKKNDIKRYKKLREHLKQENSKKK
ncbi:hypothetical protein EK386_08310 [Lysinibacillus antri]|uniref:Uncharacterized protein n=2 Tax=Lysinibacillus antri TaxID=2498145 RepID=A0A3S0RW22_9BACI|nr:hypothetical protein EK386_08310 [Lysinibacillus antri]